MRSLLPPRNVVVAVLLSFLGAGAGLCRALTGNRFSITLFTRIVILAIAAVSLNLMVGYGGLVSLCHAGLSRDRRLTIGILAYHDLMPNPCGCSTAVEFGRSRSAALASAVVAAAIGAISLRTSGPISS